MKFAAESITTRPATEADKELLWRILRDSMRDSITAARGGNWDEQRERKQCFEQLDLNCTSLMLVNDQPAGFLMTPEVDGYLNLHTICIDAPFRNAGLGAHIVAGLQSDCAQRRRSLRLSVLKANPGARRLYERLGFRPYSETTHHIHLEYIP